jgi:natural product precursor
MMPVQKEISFQFIKNNIMKNNQKKISLSEFKEVQLSVNHLSRLKGGCGTSSCSAGSTQSTGSDHDNYQGDKD